MTIQRALVGLVVVTALIFAYLNVAAQDYALAALSLALAGVWVFLEIRTTNAVGSLFFLAFLAISVRCALSNVPAPLILLGVTAVLAAWDLAQFRGRIKAEEASAAKTLLETKHLQKLAVAVGAGFVIALVPLLIQLSISFVGFCLIVLVAVLVLRRSFLSLGAGKNGA